VLRASASGASLWIDMVEVGVFPSRSDAELAQSALAAAGARLLVEQAEAESAAAVLAASDGSRRA